MGSIILFKMSPKAGIKMVGVFDQKKKKLVGVKILVVLSRVE